MGIKSIFIRPFAKIIDRKVRRMASHAIKDQNRIFRQLISQAADTRFGRDHYFSNIKSYEDYTRQVPIRDYEGLKSYFDQTASGQANILWPGKPKYLAKTSGTTSGVKYIPITKVSISTHIDAARNALMTYIHQSKNANFFEGKMIFLSGSPRLHDVGGILTGRLSGIVNHEVPYWVKSNKLPSYESNCIEDWETKVEQIAHETMQEDLHVISGIPPWVQMYFEKLLELSGKKNIKEIFPNFGLFIFGGVNYQPYKATLENLIGGPVDTVETYPASEGFIAFQDELNSNELLLNTDGGIFYEFVPLQEIEKSNPKRLSLQNVNIGEDYVVIINSNAGLWGYNIGDTIRFSSIDPYKIVVSGRVKHYISAFGEHVIAKEVEESLFKVAKEEKVGIIEFTVAPNITPTHDQLPHHEWFIEFENEPKNLDSFAKKVDQEMTRQNIYYKDLIDGNVLSTLKIRPLKKSSFIRYMKEKGKLGGQNKVPRLSNDREIASFLEKLTKP